MEETDGVPSSRIKCVMTGIVHRYSYFLQATAFSSTGRQAL